MTREAPPRHFQRVVQVAVLAVACGAAARDAGAASFRIGPAPAWVEPLAVEDGEPPAGQAGGVYDLLVDTQTRVAPGPQATYSHYARRVLNEAGLEDASQVSVDFDPSFQTLELHFVRLRRGAESHERLARRQVKLIQREPALERQIYDGTLSAVIFLEGLRVGDVVEWAFTVRGANPIFEGRFFDSFSVEWGVPLKRLRRRILWPAGRGLHVRNHRTSLEPRRHDGPGVTEYVWERREVPAVPGDSNLPAWFDATGWVQLSEHGSWGEVAAWGLRAFAPPRRLSRELSRLVEGWRQLPGPESQLVAALRFVQDEVRYLGIELGVNSHQPAAPDVVLRRRFGDCKDKALLLTVVLGALGIEAHPALVNTTYGPVLDTWQPTPLAFDHAVVRVVLGGRTLWLDATRTCQGGRPGHIFFPSYRRALVLELGASALTAIPLAAYSGPTTSIRETYVVKDYASPAELHIETRYQGPDADAMRRDFQESSRADIGKHYVNFYARNYPAIALQGPVEMRDDREANVLVTVERYTIPDFWTVPEGKARKQAELFALSIDQLIRAPDTEVRSMPLGVKHPLHVRQVTELSLPEDWPLTPESSVLSSKALRFRFEARKAPRKILLDYELRSLADSVAPPDVKDHFSTIARARDLLGYTVWRSSGPAATEASHRATLVRWLPAVLVLLELPVLLVLGVAVYLYRPQGGPPPPAGAPEGIAGWLVLPALGTLVAPVRMAVELAQTPALYSHESWSRILVGGREGLLWAGLLGFELLGNVFLMMYSILLVVVLLQRRRTYPVLFLLYLALNTGVLVTDHVLVKLVGTDAEPLAQQVTTAALAGLVPLLVWGAYFRVSERAKATFIH